MVIFIIFSFLETYKRPEHLVRTMYLPKNIINFKDKTFDPIAKFLYSFKIKPLHLTILSFVFSFIGAIFLFYMNWFFGLMFVAFSLFADGLDGTIARKYKLASAKGEFYDDISDRASELFLFMSLVLNGSVSFALAFSAYLVILVGTLLRRKIKIDFGFKRFGLFLFIFFSWFYTFIIILTINTICLILQIFLFFCKKD